MGYLSYPFEIDRETSAFNFVYDYYIPAYIDPETGEYFDQTYWQVTYAEVGEWSGGMSGYSGESGWVLMELGLPGGDTVRHYTLDFFAMNTFSAESVSASWGIIAAAYATAPVVLVGGAADELLIGGEADDILRGNGGHDILDGGAGTDILEGGEGYDRLDGGLGNDIMVGGAGDDSYFVDSAGDATVELAGGGTDSVLAIVDYTIGAQIEQLTLVGIDDIDGTGNTGHNLLTGNSGANILRGLDGDDRLLGGAGADKLYGGRGKDILNGQDGNDRLEGGEGDDTYVIADLSDIIYETAGALSGIDTVQTASGLSSYTLGNNLEILQTMGYADFHGIGNSQRNGIIGGWGNDFLQGLGESDILDGGLGDDRLEGGTGADELRGGAGRDLAIYSASAAGIQVNLGLDRQHGGEAEGDWLFGIEDVLGSDHADTIIGILTANNFDGGAGDDTLHGGWGNDRLTGGTGADTLDGGQDIDTVIYSGSSGAVRINLLALTASGGDAAGDTIANFENVIGGAAGDVLIGDGGTNHLVGLGGNDCIQGGGGNDVITGGVGLDWLDGGTGVNRVSYSTSKGSVGVDLDFSIAWGGDAEGDTIFNFDNADGGQNKDRLFGHAGANTLSGEGGDDKLYGRAGADVLRGGAGADLLDGGTGNDTASYAGATTAVYVYLSTGTGSYGDALGDSFISIENLEGGEANDYLVGDDGVNRLYGRAGFDYLDGGLGNDRLHGGAHGDMFYFSHGYGQDVVTDFVFAGDEDRVFIDMGEIFDSFEEVMARATAVGPGGIHTKFDFSGGDTLTLENVKIADLSADDFMFYWA